MNTGQPLPHDDAAIDFKGVALAIWRAKWWIVPLVLLAGGGTYMGLSAVDPQFKSDSRVLIESSASVLDANERRAEGERALLDRQGVASQQQLIESRDLARRVAKKLELAKNPEFDKVGSGKTSLLDDVMALLGIGKDPLRLSPEERVLEKYYKKLNVYTVTNSRVITVEFTSRSPQLAAKISNAIVDEYLEMQASAKRSVTVAAAGILKPEVDRLSREVKAAERRVAEFRAGADLLVGRNNLTLVQQQMADLNAQVAAARAARSEAAAKVELIRDLLKNGKPIDSASEVLASNLIQRLRERQVALKAKISELSTTLMSNHPQIKGLRSQLRGLDSQIRAEVGKILTGLQNDVKVADARIISLQGDLNALKATAAKSGDQMVRLRELERDAQVKAAELDTLLARYRRAETGKNATSLPADARVISRAIASAKPFWPKKVPMTIVATLAVLLLGIVVVILREFSTGRAIRRMSAAEPAPVLPVEAELATEEEKERQAADRTVEVTTTANPVYEASHATGERTVDEEMTAPASSESIAAALIEGPEHLLETMHRGTVKRILVTSAIGDQEAERAAMAVARASTLDRRTVLIDAHESAMVRTEKLSGRRMPGLGELMTGRASFDQVIYREPDARVHRIGCGDYSEAAGDPGAIDRLLWTLDALDHAYDLVVIDIGFIKADEVSAKLIHHADLVVLAEGAKVCQATALAHSALSLTGTADIRIMRQPAAKAVASEAA